MFRSLRASARRTKRVAAALTAALTLAIAPAPAMAAPNNEIIADPIWDWMPEQGERVIYPEPAPKYRVIYLPGKWPFPPVKVIVGVY